MNETELFEKAQEILRLLDPLNEYEKITAMEIATALRRHVTAVRVGLPSEEPQESP